MRLLRSWPRALAYVVIAALVVVYSHRTWRRAVLDEERRHPGWYFSCYQSIPTGYLDATIRPAAKSAASLQGSLGDVSELGEFAAKLDPKLVERFLKTLEDSGYDALSDVKVFYPDTPTVSLKEFVEDKSGEREIVHKAFEVRNAPDEVRTVMVELAKLIDEIRRFPDHAVRANGSWTPPRARPEGPLVGRVQLHNPGHNPATFYYPKGPWDTNASVVILVRTTGKNPKVQSAELEPDELELVDAQGAAIPVSEMIVLAPGQTIELRLHKAFYLAPGKYDSAVSLNLAVKEGIPTIVHGTLVVHMGMFDVSAR